MKRARCIFGGMMIITILSGSLFANGLSLNSIGTRALGMGGAFVGLANDATTIYWNPAGLSKVNGNSVEFFATDIIPMGTYKWEYPAFGISADASTKTNHYLSPNFFANYSMGKLALGLGLYVPAGLGAEWEGDDLKSLSGGSSFAWKSRIGVFNISPAVSYQVTEQLSLGLAANIYYAMFDLDRAGGPLPDGSYIQYSEESTGLGYGVTLGALFDVSEMISVGLSFRTKTDVTMSGTAKNPAFTQAGAPESDFDRDVSWPLWFAAGLALHPIDKLTITFDAQYSQWSESEDQFKADFDNPVWANQTAQSGDDTFVLNWKDATQIRLGLEHQTTDQLALRAGYYYDPAPAPDETVNILFPSSTNHVVSAGVGYQLNKFYINGGLEYLIGADREISADLNDPQNPMLGFKNEQPGTHHLDVFAFSLGIGYAL